MSRTLNTTLFLISISAFSSAQARTDNDGNWIENYLDRDNGSELAQFTDIENNSRWYYNLRLQGTTTVGRSFDDQGSKIEASLRLRGKTMFTDDLGFTGDFWLKAKENYNKTNGITSNHYDDLDEGASWENLIFGIESNTFGTLAYAKHSTNWAVYSTDIGMHGQYDIQMDAAGKNAGKIIYKNYFDNNLFVHTSYDTNSDIYGLDIGYQTANIYPFRPDSYSVYFSMHNGQPLLNKGYNSNIIGNVNTNSNIKSDTDYNRDSESLITYSLSGYKQFGFNGRVGLAMAYSERDNDESIREIREQGYAEGGLGFSISSTYQYFPEGFKGWGPVITVSHDEFTDKIVPQMQYWFSPQVRVWAGHIITTHGENSTQVEFQLDY